MHGPPSRAAGRLGPRLALSHRRGLCARHLRSVRARRRRSGSKAPWRWSGVSPGREHNDASAKRERDAIDRRAACGRLRWRSSLRWRWRSAVRATDLMHRMGGTNGKTCSPRSQWLSRRAIACKAPRQRRHSRQPWECRICNLQNLKTPGGFESHPLRQTQSFAFNELAGAVGSARAMACDANRSSPQIGVGSSKFRPVRATRVVEEKNGTLSRARSPTEASLYRRLETLPDTKARFRLNVAADRVRWPSGR